MVDRFEKEDQKLARIKDTRIYKLLEERSTRKTTYCVKDNSSKCITPKPTSYKIVYDRYGNIINGCLNFKDDYINLMNGYPNSNIQKLESNDVYSELLFSLITQLESIQGSGLTILIDNYLNSVDFFTEHDPFKYDPIKKGISSCLESHGWKSKNKHTAGGLKSQPNRVGIANNIRSIYNKYF